MLVLVLCARDLVTFLAGWELMTLVPAAIILVSRSDALARRTVFLYVAITHLAGVGVWVVLLELARLGAFEQPGALAAEPQAVQAAVWIGALVGFGAKAGVVPLHVWLPRAHPIAPAHVSALMSGVMVKVALYGLVRVLVEWTEPPLLVGGAVVALGAASALVGVVYALLARDLKRLLALSSIENVGIVLLGLGAALMLSADGDPRWAAVALAAALLHVVNHAACKALLFLAAGAIDRSVGGLGLDRLGGLLTRMPRVGWPMLAGAAAIAGLPPLNAFVSEWLTLQALLRLPADGAIGSGVAGAIALAVLATVAAMSIYCFAAATGLVLLGRPRRPAVEAAQDAPVALWVPCALLAATCVLLAALPGVVLPWLVRLAPGGSEVDAEVHVGVPGGAVLPSLALLAVVAAVAAVLVRLRGPAAPEAPAWASGAQSSASLAWTAAGFTKPLRLVLDALLRPSRQLDEERRGGVVQRISYRGEVPHHFDALYAPVVQGALVVAARARRLQSGRLSFYVAYLVGLVAVLLACVRLGVLT